MASRCPSHLYGPSHSIRGWLNYLSQVLIEVGRDSEKMDTQEETLAKWKEWDSFFFFYARFQPQAIFLLLGFSAA